MRFLADENFNGPVLRGLQRVLPDVDIIRVQDTEMYGASDPELLEWAAQENCILLTHDVQTVTGFAYERVQQGLPMPGIIEVRLTKGIGGTIDELSILIGAGIPADFENQVRYVPLR
jgi:predicted nuclease of predicted toxin-antitoxin system